MGKKITDTNLAHFFEYGVNVQDRIIYYGSSLFLDDGSEGGVEAFSTARFLKGLLLLENAAPQGDKPITIVMNTPGGEVHHGLAVYDAIKSCVNFVTIVVYGQASSMGSWILQAGDKRILSQNAEVMIHYGTEGSYPTHTHIFISNAKNCDKLNKKMEQMYLNRIKEKHPDFKLSRLRKMLNFDTSLSAQDAINLGLVDEILPHKD